MHSETRIARQQAKALDLLNKVTMDLGQPIYDGARRSDYPLGFGPGEMLLGPDRAKVAAYVDAA